MKKLVSLALAIVMCLSLVACGGNSDGGNISNLAPATTAPAPAAEAPEAPAADVAQEMTFVLSDEPDGIDPTVTNNSFAMYVLVNCFEGLVSYDESGSIVPALAESWDISEDGTVYTFHLREGLKWSDGSPLTAKDFVYSIQRVLTPATTAQYYSMISDYIKGAKEFYEGTGTAEELGVKALDDRTLEITLLQPTSFVLDLVSMW